MDKTRILERVRAVVAREFDMPEVEIKPETNLRDLDIDSIGILEIVLGLEEEFELDISDEDTVCAEQDSATVQRIADYIERRLEKNG